ncbi:MAG: hypothetical protein NVSMB51_14940 [Solirubrobacteraceae bacterium]
MSSQSDTKAQIESAIKRVLEEVPQLEPLKLVLGLDLRGRGDVQQYRVELPGPKITKDIGTDAKVRVEMQRPFFNEMAKDAKVADWGEAFHYGQAKATGVPQYLQLIQRVVALHEERLRARRARREP